MSLGGVVGLPLEVALLFLIGLVSAVINTLAGGGTLLTVPAMVLLGFGPLTANATNRAGLVIQSLSATVHYRRRRVLRVRQALQLTGIVCVGAGLGAWLATRLPERTFGQVMAVLMVAALLFLLLRPARWFASRPAATSAHPVLAGLGLLGVGLYGGFFGAGVGIFILLLLAALQGLDLVAGNTVKSVMVLALSLSASAMFAALGWIDYRALLPLAAGNAVGGWVGAHLSLRGGNVWIRRLLLLVVIAGVYKLLRYP
ncbi:MAG: sulfite exporter TauE/SafE family protein [Acidobacteriota bacterium]|jgi:hypothetical protein